MNQRQQVKSFAAGMEAILQKHDNKGGWDNASFKWLFTHLKSEALEIEWAYAEGNPEKVLNECLDIANFAMMIADRFGGLLQAYPMTTCEQAEARWR